MCRLLGCAVRNVPRFRYSLYGLVEVFLEEACEVLEGEGAQAHGTTPPPLRPTVSPGIEMPDGMYDKSQFVSEVDRHIATTASSSSVIPLC